MQSYFEILGLAPAFTLDLKALEQGYFTAQRACHPDRFIGRGEAERVAAISRSTLVNVAYETLKNPLTRAEHLLELRGHFVLSDEYVAPPALLMEMMELRERLEEAGHEGAALSTMLAELKAMGAANEKALAAAFATDNIDAAIFETLRLQYLGKAIEEAHMLIYRLKAAHG